MFGSSFPKVQCLKVTTVNCNGQYTKHCALNSNFEQLGCYFPSFGFFSISCDNLVLTEIIWEHGGIATVKSNRARPKFNIKY